MEENLINNQDLAKALGLKISEKSFLLDAIGKITGIQKLNESWNQVKNLPSVDVLETFLKNHRIQIEIDEKDLKKIPKSGAFISISNHPFGALDGIILIYLLMKERPDFKVMANFLLQKLSSIQEFFIPVNPLESFKKASSSVGGIKGAFAHLEKSGALGIFPAGEVSSFQLTEKRVTDRKWQAQSIRFIQKAKVPVVPIFFEGRNSNVFQILGLFHPLLRTAVLPSELFKKEGTVIKVRIGTAIKPSEIAEFSDIDRLGKYLRARTYSLAAYQKISGFFSKPLQFPKKPQDIAEAIDYRLIYPEIERIQNSGKCILQNGNYQVFLSSYHQIPNIMHEIGRLREITFRAVGEGSNRNLDLDEFDLAYEHLFLWDSSEKRIAGAYRLGLGNKIMELYGIKGFYTSTLFKMDGEFKNILRKSIELGRSFIVQDYQQKALPLYLLWQGIITTAKNHSACEYLFGPVSISNNFSKLSKELIVEVMLAHYAHPKFGNYIKPKKKFRLKSSDKTAKTLIDVSKEDIKKVDNLIGDIEHSGLKMPVLVKKYLKQNAKILGFNVDPKFNNALDGLIIMAVEDLPTETKSMLNA